ncbi:MAG TPA: SH3 domain-containing protein [Myxococcota bacterium]|nr:SH3 domain-containing protein [Myxococcota bacterium]
MRLRARAIPLASLALALGCQNPALPAWLARAEKPAPAPAPTPAPSAEIDPEVLARAQNERYEYLEREVARLREDLQQAEDSIVQLESGLRGLHTRADAVSAVAEARIALDRVSAGVPWRRERVAEARAKLEEADRQLASDHLGAAVFFASRARRITDSLRAETQQVAKWRERRVIRGDRVNLRSAPTETASVVEVLVRETPLYPERSLPDWTLVRTPDGRVGWVQKQLLN